MPRKKYTDDELSNMSTEEFLKYMDKEPEPEEEPKEKKKKKGFLGILNKRHQQIREAMGD